MVVDGTSTTHTWVWMVLVLHTHGVDGTSFTHAWVRSTNMVCVLVSKKKKKKKKKKLVFKYTDIL